MAADAGAIAAYRARRLARAASCARLAEAHGAPVSYHAVWRLVQRQEPPAPQAVVRGERPPGAAAQVDVGYAGLTIDPVTAARRRRGGVVLTLAGSRPHDAEGVCDQRGATWRRCHRPAVAWWPGASARRGPATRQRASVRARCTEPVAPRA